jgi:hypothetical protein
MGKPVGKEDLDIMGLPHLNVYRRVTITKYGSSSNSNGSGPFAGGSPGI